MECTFDSIVFVCLEHLIDMLSFRLRLMHILRILGRSVLKGDPGSGREVELQQRGLCVHAP